MNNNKIFRTFIKHNNRTYNNFYKLYYSEEEILNSSIYNDYFNNKFYLLTDRIDGLGARTMALFSTIYFAKIFKDFFDYNQIPIILHWVRNDGMGSNFNELFNIINNNDVLIIEDNNFNHKWRIPHDEYKIDYPRIYREIKDLQNYKNKKAVHNVKHIDSFYSIISDNDINIWKNHNNFYVNKYVEINDDIKNIGNSLLKNINNQNLLGIHIRTTDLKKLNLKYYVNFIKTYNLENNIFIIASQDNEDIDFFKSHFPNTTFIKQFIKINSIKDTSKKQLYYNLGYFDNQTRKNIMYQDMVDYYLLSKCSIIITNSRDSLTNNKEISSYIKSILLYNSKIVISLYNGSNCLNISNIISKEINNILK